MNLDEFRQHLHQLEEADWQAVMNGRSILIVDDRYLETGPADAENACLGLNDGQGAGDGAELKEQIMNNAEQILNNYYLDHALTAEGFRYQVERLFVIHGICAFAAAQDCLPDRTLFVEGGEVIAEHAESPRHRYGVYCELDHDMSGEECEVYIRQWLEQGEAHEQYLGMNVCRYNC